MKMTDRLSPRNRLLIQMVLLTIAFTSLRSEWTIAVGSVFWVCFVASALLFSRKVKSQGNPFDLGSNESLITMAQFMAIFTVQGIASDKLPEGWFQSVVRTPSALFACWVLVVLQDVRWYLRAKNDRPEFPTTPRTVP